MNASDLASIRREIRSAALFDAPSRPSLPPPNDLDSERVVLLAVFDNRLRATDTGLWPMAFYSPAHQCLWAAAQAAEEMGIELTPLRALQVLSGQGGRAEDCAEAIARITAETPWTYRLDGAIARIKRLARRRDLIAVGQRVDAAWRLDQEAAPEDIAVLRAAFADRKVAQ